MRRRYKKGTGIGVIAVLVFVICSIIFIKKIELVDKSEAAEAEIEQLEAEIKKQEEREKEIDQRLAYVQTKKFIEDVARDKLGLVYEDEILFKAVE